MTPDRAIYKYNAWKKDLSIEVPLGKVVLVGTQYPSDDLPTLWIEHRFSRGEINTIDLQKFRIIGTGRKMIDPREEHVGSCICALGTLVWHVYRFNV